LEAGIYCELIKIFLKAGTGAIFILSILTLKEYLKQKQEERIFTK
jgi:hypothetical protein